MEMKKAYGQQKRTTPEFITSLEPNEIFVFGSNLKGMHGGGAAYIAYRKFGEKKIMASLQKNYLIIHMN